MSAPPFRNWAGTAMSQPHAWVQPADEAELTALLQRAAQEGRHVKVVGAGHSWSDIACTDGYLVNLDRMARLVRVDRSRGPDQIYVTVQAGIRLHALIRALQAHDLTLPVVGSVTQQSIAGAIATGTHGNAPALGNLSSRVVALRIALADGQIVDASPDENSDLFYAGKVHLGALGILTAVTLHAVPAFSLREESQLVSIDDVVATLPQIWRSAPYVKLWWLPHVSKVRICRARPTTEPSNLSATAHFIDEHIVNRRIFARVLDVSRRIPAIIPTMNRAVSAIYFRPSVRCGPNTSILPLPMPPAHEELEYAVPLAHATDLLSGLRDLIDRHRLRVNFLVELRPVAADDAWLSPMHGRASLCATLCIGSNMGRHREIYFAEAERLLQRLSGRPHWGKTFTADSRYLRAQFPHWDRFVALRDRLHPDRRFGNPFLSRVFGD